MPNVTVKQTGVSYEIVITVDGQAFTYTVDNVKDLVGAKAKLLQDLQDEITVVQNWDATTATATP